VAGEIDKIAYPDMIQLRPSLDELPGSLCHVNRRQETETAADPKV
jgi:hypothetical protein